MDWRCIHELGYASNEGGVGKQFFLRVGKIQWKDLSFKKVLPSTESYSTALGVFFEELCISYMEGKWSR